MLKSPACEPDHDHGEDGERQQQLPARGLTNREPRDGQRCHLACSASRSARNRSSSVWRTGSTAYTLAPLATTSATSSGTRSTSTPSTTNHPSCSASAPRRASGPSPVLVQSGETIDPRRFRAARRDVRWPGHDRRDDGRLGLQICSTSPSRWLESKRPAQPRSRRCRMIVRASAGQPGRARTSAHRGSPAPGDRAAPHQVRGAAACPSKTSPPGHRRGRSGRRSCSAPEICAGPISARNAASRQWRPRTSAALATPGSGRAPADTPRAFACRDPLRGRPSSHASPPAGRLRPRGLHGGRLAAAVRSEESEYLSSRHGHGEPGERD